MEAAIKQRAEVLEHTDVDIFIEGSQIEPGTLEHLYPEAKETD